MQTFYAGVDLGGTNLRAAVIDASNGELLAVRRTPTPLSNDPQELIERMAELVEAVGSECGVPRDRVGGVGVGVPGLVDMGRGVVMHLPNVPGDWPNVPFTALLSRRLGIPVSLLNDVRCTTLGEYCLGAGRGAETMSCYAIGTGVGGGSVINGRLHLGLSGSAGEVGHQVVEPNGPPCKCGGRGCLEVFAAGPAIRAEGLAAVNHGLAPILTELCAGDLNRVSVALMAQAARQGDQDARAIFERAGHYLGLAIGNTLANISPNRVVISGGVCAAYDLLIDAIWKTLRERIFLVPLDQVEITPGTLGGDAGLIGAALWAREQRAG